MATTQNYTYPAAAGARPHAVSTVATQVGSGTITYEGYSYDGAGNTTARPGQVLEYNTLGQLKKTTIGSTTQKNVYDADGGLLMRVDSSSGNTLYLGMTELRTAAGSTVVAGTRTYSAMGIPVAERTTQAGVTGSILRWLTTDLVGTSQLEIQNTTGLQTRRYTDPYGKPKGTVPSWSSEHGYLNAPTSMTTGLTHLGARDYDPNLGRFTTVDSVLAPGNPQQNNGYSYAGNNPVTRSDPTGECYTAGDHYYAGSCTTGPSPKTGTGTQPPSAPGDGDVPWLETALEAGSDKSGWTGWTKRGILDGWSGMDYRGQGQYTTNPNAMQLAFGYADLYDAAFNAGTDMVPKKFTFEYNGETYVFWVWKGDYINMGAGAEIGIYKNPVSLGIFGEIWSTVPNADAPAMSMRLSGQGGEEIASFAPAQSQSWVGGYNSYVQDPSADSLTADYSVTFPNQAMYDAFQSSGSVSGSDWYFPKGSLTATLRFRRRKGTLR